MSDHLAPTVTFDLDGEFDRTTIPTSRTEKSGEFRMINEANNGKFSELIGSVDWSILSGLSGETKINRFLDIYNDLYNRAYPLAKNRKRRKNERVNSKPWITPWLEDACNRKNKLYHEWGQSLRTCLVFGNFYTPQKT